MIKIAHIANPVAGVGVYLDLLVRYSNKIKFSHIILCDSDCKFSNIHFDSIHYITLTRNINVTQDIKSLFNIIKILTDLKPDIIHCHSAKAGVLGRIAGSCLNIPTLYTPHAYSYLSAESKVRRILYKNLEKLFRFFPSKTLACSPSEYNRTVNELNFKVNKVLLWNNTIEDILEINNSELAIKLPNNFICSVGRPSYQKNTKLLIETIVEVKKEIENIHLVILGVGFYSPDLKVIEELIKNYNLKKNVTLIKWLKRSELLGIIKNSLLYISTSKYEGLPYAVIEALALSKACIVTNVDGNKDLIKNKLNGFLVEENAPLIAEKIVELLKNEVLLKQMSKNARKDFEKKYVIQNNISSLEKIYLSQIKNNGIEE